MMLVASADGSQQWRCLISHCRCASSALSAPAGDSAATCSIGCAWGFAGVETTTGSCRGSGQPATLYQLRGMLQGAIINLSPTPRPTNINLLSLTALWLPDSLRFVTALSTSYFGTCRFLQDAFGPSVRLRAAARELGTTPPSSP